MRVDLFDYELPQELIAQHPAERREEARLLVLERPTGRIWHCRFDELEKFLGADDCLVLNDTQVLPARLLGHRKSSGGKWEGLFLQQTDAGWELMTRTGGKLVAGERIVLEADRFELELIRKTLHGTWIARPVVGENRDGGPLDLGNTLELLQSVGHVPLPPYIRDGRDEPADRARYQTVFARRPGAVAAPTAGLHFSESLLEQLQSQGVRREFVTLHVGPGTFRPVKTENTAEHRMHAEWCELPGPVAERLQAVRQANGRIVAVGTTVVRVLESACRQAGQLVAFRDQTDLFIFPPYEFRAVDVLVTNFHLPRSTLLMLVCAFGGTEQVLEAYRTAIQASYRFYSYGDAMLIV